MFNYALCLGVDLLLRQNSSVYVSTGMCSGFSIPEEQSPSIREKQKEEKYLNLGSQFSASCLVLDKRREFTHFLGQSSNFHGRFSF